MRACAPTTAPCIGARSGPQARTARCVCGGKSKQNRLAGQTLDCCHDSILGLGSLVLFQEAQHGPEVPLALIWHRLVPDLALGRLHPKLSEVRHTRVWAKQRQSCAKTLVLVRGHLRCLKQHYCGVALNTEGLTQIGRGLAVHGHHQTSLEV